MTYTIANKNATYKWRDNHKEHFLELERGYQRSRYQKNPEAQKQKTLANYYYKKELATFLKILIGEL
jgi:hypothetical protein